MDLDDDEQLEDLHEALRDCIAVLVSLPTSDLRCPPAEEEALGPVIEACFFDGLPCHVNVSRSAAPQT